MSSAEHAPERLPRIQSVSPAKAPWTLNVVWADGAKSRVDLTGLVHRSRHFRRFLDDPAAFRKVGVTEWGSGVEWNNGLDYGADTLKMIADEQRPVTGADLFQFEVMHGLSTAETAKLFGLAERTIRNYRGMPEVPQAVAIALKAFIADSTMLAAHYHPAGQPSVGRPRSTSGPAVRVLYKHKPGKPLKAAAKKVAARRPTSKRG